MDRAEAARLLAEHAAARDTLLSRATAEAAATGRTLWRVGSGATGTGDAWSDLDLLATPDAPPLGDPALTTVNPWNGPRGGGYTGAAYLTGPLLVWIDWYVWPAELPAPAEAELLTATGTRGELGLSPTLDAYGRGESADSEPGAFALAMIPIAAKYAARGRTEDAAGMVAWLGGDGDGDPIAELRGLLAEVDLAAVDAPGGAVAVAERVGLLLDVAEALRP